VQVLGIIPARGGSKGIPGKNLRLLGGKPLLAYTVEAARAAGFFSRLVLSTDSEEIASVGRSLGVEVPFLRPPELARDETPMLPVIQHTVRFLAEKGWSPDVVVILQPTAPFRRATDLRGAWELLQANPEVESVVSLEAVPAHYAPHFIFKIEGDRMVPFMPDGLQITRRQDAPKAYSRTGEFYFTRIRTLMQSNSIYGQNSRPYVVSHPYRVNLDTLEDWADAERVVQHYPGPGE
jgi:N-acylneuraminate cytidylyltransferase